MTLVSRQAGVALTPPPTWVRVLLGLVLVFAGLVVLGDAVMATVISAIFIGISAIIAGGFEIVHAFWTKGWGGFLWQIFLGILYLAFGFALVSQPISGAVVLTYVLGLLLFVSGLVRIFLGLRHWSEGGSIMLFSGALGLIAGLIILTRWPMSGLWVLGLVLAIDLIAHGIAWLTFAWRPEVGTTA
ncbi:MAG TPA: HdeD family acid-resistance protein [Xanthobacteraceae bacterium]